MKEIVLLLPRGSVVSVFGDVDETGRKVIADLCGLGYCVSYLGYVDEVTKRSLFASHSHYLHLAENEPFGITLIEAMLSGCVPVAHHSGGVSEYLPSWYLYREAGEAVSILLDERLNNSGYRIVNRLMALEFDVPVFRGGLLRLIDGLFKG